MARRHHQAAFARGWRTPRSPASDLQTRFSSPSDDSTDDGFGGGGDGGWRLGGGAVARWVCVCAMLWPVRRLRLAAVCVHILLPRYGYCYGSWVASCELLYATYLLSRLTTRIWVTMCAHALRAGCAAALLGVGVGAASVMCGPCGVSVT